MLYLARIAIALAVIGFVCSQFVHGELIRSPRFGFIPGESLVEEPFPRFGLGWMEGLREAYCRRFCSTPSANMTNIQNLMCFIRCPDFISPGSPPGFPPFVTTEPTGSAGPTPPATAPTPPRAG